MYVIDLSPPSYMNHSCAPNCYVKMESLELKDVYALQDIAPDEELTIDYTLTAVDQFAGQGFWEFDCNCGSKECRGKITGDFFTLPRATQLKFYKNLPLSIIQQYIDHFERLLGSC